jgi:hypothetical protein
MDRSTQGWVALLLTAGMASASMAQWKNPADNPMPPQVLPPEPASGPLVLGPDLAPEPRNLAPRFIKGWSGTYWFGLDSREDKRDPKRPNESGGMRVQQQIVLTISCVSADDEAGSSFDIRIDEVKLDLQGMGADIFFDSTLAPNPLYNEETNKKINEETPIKSAIKPLIGTSFTVMVDSKGNVVKAVGGQAFEAAQSNPLTSAIFSMTALRTLLEPVVSPTWAPIEKLGVGSTWSRREPVSLSTGKLVVADNYRLQGLSDDAATVTMEGKVIPEVSTSSVRVVGSKRQGLIEVNPANGMLRSYEFQDDMRMAGKAIDDGRELSMLNVRRVKVALREPTTK